MNISANTVTYDPYSDLPIHRTMERLSDNYMYISKLWFCKSKSSWLYIVLTNNKYVPSNILDILMQLKELKTPGNTDCYNIIHISDKFM